MLVSCLLTAPGSLPLTAVAALLGPTLRLSCCVPPCALAVPVSRLSSFALLLGCGLSALSLPSLSGLSLPAAALPAAACFADFCCTADGAVFLAVFLCWANGVSENDIKKRKSNSLFINV